MERNALEQREAHTQQIRQDPGQNLVVHRSGREEPKPAVSGIATWGWEQKWVSLHRLPWQNAT